MDDNTYILPSHEELMERCKNYIERMKEENITLSRDEKIHKLEEENKRLKGKIELLKQYLAEALDHSSVNTSVNNTSVNTNTNTLNCKQDRHSPGYMREYMRRRRGLA